MPNSTHGDWLDNHSTDIGPNTPFASYSIFGYHKDALETGIVYRTVDVARNLQLTRVLCNILFPFLVIEGFHILAYANLPLFFGHSCFVFHVGNIEVHARDQLCIHDTAVLLAQYLCYQKRAIKPPAIKHLFCLSCLINTADTKFITNCIVKRQ